MYWYGKSTAMRGVMTEVGFPGRKHHLLVRGRTTASSEMLLDRD